MSLSRAPSLRALFPLLVASVAPGCGGTADPDAPSKTDFPLSVACTSIDTRWEAATPSPSYDGFEIRRGKGGGEEASVVRTIAPLCSLATDKAACAAAAAAVPVKGWDPYGGADVGPRPSTPELAVATTGDQVRAITTIDELGEALAPIDSVNEAAALVALRGYEPYCEGSSTTAQAARKAGESFELSVSTSGSCGGAVKQAVIRVDPDGRVTTLTEKVLSPGGPNACGRRPETLLALDERDMSGAGGLPALLARMAYLEAASVPAFATLARDLARHGLPAPLLARLEAARRDEIRHARLMRAAARRHGVVPPTPRTRRASPRSLFQIAMENAVEGCVRETFGALVATHQARHAGDAALRTLFASIAVDETEHAALSWDLADWLEARLTEEERSQLAVARARALADLYDALEEEPSLGERREAGMPSREVARGLLRALDSTLLAA